MIATHIVKLIKHTVILVTKQSVRHMPPPNSLMHDGVQKELSNQDVLALIDDISTFIIREKIDGVISTSDDLGTLLMAILAQRNGMPAPDPEVVIRQEHKAN